MPKKLSINKYIQSTDSFKIKNVAIKYGADVPFIRPKKYSTEKATSVDALIHAVQFIENKDNQLIRLYDMN